MTLRLRGSSSSPHPQYYYPIHIPLIFCGALMTAWVAGSAHHPWLAWVGLLPVLLAIRALPPRLAAFSGFLWGVCTVACCRAMGVAQSDPANPVVCSVSAAAAPAVYAYVGAVLTARIGFNPLLLALAWVGVEAALSPLHLSNGVLGALQEDSATTHLVSGLLQYGLLGFASVLAAACFLAVADSIEINPPSFALSLPGAGVGVVRTPADPLLLPTTRSHRSTGPRAPPNAPV